MSTLQQKTSSGSDRDQYMMIDERKKRRMLSNRESARRSRMRKQQQLENLVNQTSQLQKQNAEIMHQINAITQLYLKHESENNVLRAQIMELTDTLRSLNSILELAEEVSGLAVDIPEIPGNLLEPWQLPCPSQPIMAASDVFQF